MSIYKSQSSKFQQGNKAHWELNKSLRMAALLTNGEYLQNNFKWCIMEESKTIVEKGLEKEVEKF